MFFGPFVVAVASLGEEGAGHSASRAFVRFVLVWVCRFPLPLGVWEGQRFVIVELPGLSSYIFSLPKQHCYKIFNLFKWFLRNILKVRTPGGKR